MTWIVRQTEKEFLDVLEAKGSRGAKIQRVTNGYGLSESVRTSLLFSHSLCSNAQLGQTLAVMAQPVVGMFDGTFGPMVGSSGVLLPGTASRMRHPTISNPNL